MPTQLSIICSSLAICITAIKVIVPAWRLYHEWTHPKPIVKPKSIRELKLWMDTSISAFFVILSLLLLVFSFVGPEEKGLQILLSLAGGSLLVYQRGYVWIYCGSLPYWLRWAPLLFFIATTIISILIAQGVSHTRALKKILLSLLLGEYVGLFIEYLFRLLFGEKLSPRVSRFILWNMGFCCLAWVGALASLVSYLKGNVDFITSLWINVATAMGWVVWVLWKQWTALQKARSLEEDGLDKQLGVPQQDLLRQDSTSQLVAPSAVYLHDSRRG